MTPNPQSRCLFTVEAESDPQLPCRILGLFTQRGYLPEWFSVRKSREHALRVVVEVTCLDEHTCEVFARKILNIPTVLEVSRGWLRQFAEIAP